MRIFISYSHQDKPTVDLITDRLKQAGHEVWIDHLKLRPGDNISRKIHEGIGSADAILVVVSANALRSKWMLQEFSSLALSELSKREPKIIPVLLDDSAVPSYLSNYLYLDLSRDLAGGLDKLVHSLEIVQRKEADTPRRSTEQRTDSLAGQVAALGGALLIGPSNSIKRHT